MNVAVLSESEADEAAVRILVEGLLSKATKSVIPVRLRSRGWPSVLGILPKVLHALYYQSDAEGLVVVVDSNHSPVVSVEDEADGGRGEKSRLGQLRNVVDQERSRLKPLPGRAMIKTAIGVAVPTVEAWYLCGRDSRVGEEGWVGGLEAHKEPYSKNQLKEAVYGTDRPSLALEIRRGVEEARRLTEHLDQLEAKFPVGFGSLAKDVRGWIEA